jgi:hypothetical protein
MNVSAISGYDRALRRAGRLEDSWREFPFLGITERICSVEVNLLTLRMFVELCNVRSPLFVGGPVRPGDIAVFLWRLSPMYQKTLVGRDGRARQKFIASIIALPYAKIRRAINRFLDRMLIDKPPVTDGPSSQPDVSFVASFIHELAAAYGWSRGEILDLPMPEIFQYFREIRRDKYAAAGKSVPRFNPLRARLTKRIINRALNGRALSPRAPRISATPTRRARRSRPTNAGFDCGDFEWPWCAVFLRSNPDSKGRQQRICPVASR